MVLYTKDKYDKIRTLALLEAVSFCGGEEILGTKIKVERSVINQWINQPNIEIPYNKALLITDVTGINVERLLINKTKINKYPREIVDTNKLMLRDVLVNGIIIVDLPYLPYPKPDRHIIIGTDCILISGLVELKASKEAQQEKIKAIILDLEAAILGISTIKNIINTLLISERVAIGLRLEQLLENRQD